MRVPTGKKWQSVQIKKCPICNARKQNILLHIKTKKTCFMKIDKQVFEKWSKMARYNTQKAQNRKSKEK